MSIDGYIIELHFYQNQKVKAVLIRTVSERQLAYIFNSTAGMEIC